MTKGHCRAWRCRIALEASCDRGSCNRESQVCLATKVVIKAGCNGGSRRGLATKVAMKAVATEIDAAWQQMSQMRMSQPRVAAGPEDKGHNEGWMQWRVTLRPGNKGCDEVCRKEGL